MNKSATTGRVHVRRLSKDEALADIAALSRILLDCVEGNAAVSFMRPFGEPDAQAFFRGVIEEEVGTRTTALFAAYAAGALVGTVQLRTAMSQNQPHRAEIKKMLVLSAMRRRGVGAALLVAAEDEARRMGKTLLCLDTASGGAGERLYRAHGWIAAGLIPGYAFFPDGRPHAAAIYYKELGPRLERAP